MRIIAGLLTLASLSACVDQAGPRHMRPDPPPKIGEVTATLDGKPIKWETYDYSVGAFDSAVQITGFEDAVQFRLYGVPPRTPRARLGVIYVRGVMQHPDQPGPLTDVVVEMPLSEMENGPRMTSTGVPAYLRLDSITLDEGGYTGKVTGFMNVILCKGFGEPIRVNTEDCQVLTGTFASDMQFDGVERFR